MSRNGRGRRSLRELLLGAQDRLGMWTLPLFIAVGLLGAVLAGALTTVHYAGRVAALERETAEARRELNEAVERVSEAADEGVAAIEQEVSGVLDQLAVNPPVGDPLEHGLVAVRTTVVIERPPPPPPSPSPDGRDDGEGEDDAASEGERADPQPQPRTETRFGSGFAVIADDESAYVVTSFALVDDPLRRGTPVERAQVLVGSSSVDARVHSWHRERDVALLRVDGVRGLRVADWRPADEPPRHGDHLFLTGLTPGGDVVQLRAGVGTTSEELIVVDTAVPDLLRGGPVLDVQGRVVGVVSTDYAPYGAGGANRPVVPVRLLCEQLIRCGDADVGAERPGD